MIKREGFGAERLLPFRGDTGEDDYPQLAANRFKYNGKEEQVTGNLEWLDYGARMYDSGLGDGLALILFKRVSFHYRHIIIVPETRWYL